LKKWSLILVVSGQAADSVTVNDKEKKEVTAQNNSDKIDITLYSDTAPFNKEHSFQIEKFNFDFASVANDFRKEQTSILLALATINPDTNAAKLIKLELDKAS